MDAEQSVSRTARTVREAATYHLSETKELIALALGVAAHCDGCIGFHTEALVKLGATRQEIEEALGMAVYMGAGRR